MFSLALVVKTEEHLLSYIEKNCSSFGHLWTLLGEMGACLAVGGKAWLSPRPSPGCGFAPLDLCIEMQSGKLQCFCMRQPLIT